MKILTQKAYNLTFFNGTNHIDKNWKPKSHSVLSGQAFGYLETPILSTEAFGYPMKHKTQIWNRQFSQNPEESVHKKHITKFLSMEKTYEPSSFLIQY